MKRLIQSNGKLQVYGFSSAIIRDYSLSRPGWKNGMRILFLSLLVSLPITLSAELILPAIPSNSNLAKRFELSTEFAFRVKTGETWLETGALIAYINNEIRGAQTASVKFPPTGEMIYKILIFNDTGSGDSIRFKYYDVFSEKIYEIKEKIEFKADLVPDYANPLILNAFCPQVDKVTGMVPENGKEDQNSTLDLYWQPSPNANYYNLFLWEAGAPVPTTPHLSNLSGTTARIYNLTSGKSYNWKIVSVNDCSTSESSIQTFKTRYLPDLTVTDIQIPQSIESGTYFTVNFKVKNIGLGSTFSALWSDAVYISDDASFSGDDKLLITTPNRDRLAVDSIYDQSVDISLPVEYSGEYYLFIKTDYNNLLSEILEDNNLVNAGDPINVTLKVLPDILVKDIQAETTSVIPGDSLLIDWKVENAGGAAASGGWIERVFIIPETGLKLSVEPNSNYNSDLAAGSIVSRSIRFKIPEIVKFSGNANIEVELIPSSSLLEHSGDLANNKALSAGSVNILNVLYLDIQTGSLLENTTEPARCILSRSGDYSLALALEITISSSGQVSIPSSLIIPSNSSSVVFDLHAINNSIMDGPRNIALTVTAPGYRSVTGSIELLDDETPALIAQLDKNTVTEGDTAFLTISRDLVSDQLLTVYVSTDNPSQWVCDPSVIIGSNNASVVVPVTVTDDEIPELTGQAKILVSSAGYVSGQTTATVVDNDIPEIQLTLLSDTVSESAGVYATWGVIRRVKGDNNVEINLTGDPSGALYFPAAVKLPKGTVETKFNIGVVDNDQVDGFRSVEITGSIYLSACDCGTSPENGGVVQDKLIIADNDGPALTVTVDQVSLLEGKTGSGKLTIARNTPVDKPLSVDIRHNDTTEIEIQTSAIIPAGQKSVQVPINTKDDNIDDGDQMVTIQASAPLFSPGYCFIFVTDQNKVELSLRAIELSSDSAIGGEFLEIRGTMLNSGHLTAPSKVKINFYLSEDDLTDDNDQVLGQYETPRPVVAGDSIQFAKVITLPKSSGDYFVIAGANPGNVLNELIYTNNISDPVPFKILPEYSAAAIVDQDFFMPNNPVPIHGTAFRSDNQPVANADVDIYILINGTRRELTARTRDNGTYSVEFSPLMNETGHFTVGACYPGLKLEVMQDVFDILGMQRDSTGYIIWEMKLGQTMSGVIGIKNTSKTPLNNLTVEPVSLPAGCQLTFNTIEVLPGLETKQFKFTLKATELSAGTNYEKVNLNVKSGEGVSTEIEAYYYCQAVQGQLKASPASINTTITKGKSRLYEFYIYSNGAGETGSVTINLPDVPWMTLISPATISNLAPRDTATVILKLTPETDTPLNTPITGNIALNCVNGTGVTIPYRIEAVSEETGSLQVDVVDEYTYFTEAAPHVSNAHVVVCHPFSGDIVAEGFTGSNGIFRAENMPEGSYTMTIEAEKHRGYQNTIAIDPGRVNEQKIFLSFQAITYTWEVVPTGIGDEYKVELVMKFETNVPVPVVIIEMPSEMPQLVNDETYPFLVTLTNKGLITALDLELFFPTDDPEYEFITNFTKLDLLAQQAIQVPVVMKRKDSGSKSGGCVGFAIAAYGVECGKDKQWHNSNHGFSFSGRICAGGGGGTPGYYCHGCYGPCRDCGSSPSGPSDPGGGGGGSSSIGCDNCLIDVGLAALSCIPVIGAAFNAVSCVKSFADFDVSIRDVAACVGGFIPGYGCPIGLTNAAYGCYEDPWIFVDKGASTAIAKAGTLDNMPPILRQAIKDMEYFIHRHKAELDWISEFIGGMNWQSKESFFDFVDQIDPFIKEKKQIQTAELLIIQLNMIGTDITADEISDFAIRWNNTLQAYSLNIFSPTAEYPNIIDNNLLEEYVAEVDSVQSYVISRGYSNIGEMYNEAIKTINEQVEEGRNSVCASVTIQIDQEMVMTREAFEGTLTIYNGNETAAMEEIKLNLEIKDENGYLCNDLFHIETKALDILTGIDGTGSLAPEEKGSATILFIPEKGAAPEVPKSYSFGGTFSYLDPFTGVTVTMFLFPVTLDVNPSPDLWLHYFMQRDILGDDPLTEPVEPIIPAELAVMIENNGFGIARNVRIESAQPEIIENEKGLAINFALIGSNLNGQPRQLGLTNIDFGNIAPKSSAIGQWWFTSDLLGHFISYETKLTHLNSRGNPELSLVSGATLHELIRSVRVYGSEDGVDDFLVNEMQDAKETPDAIFLSSGGVLDVWPASGMSALGSISPPDYEIDLIVTPFHIGWNYAKISDPGNGRFKVVSVTREDGRSIPLSNVWQTHVTLPDGKEPVYENMLHFVDAFDSSDPVKYRIRFVAKDENVPEIIRIDNVPEHFVVNPVTSVTVVFNTPIDPSTFTYEDMTLRVQGGPNIMDATVTVTMIDPTIFSVDLSSKTHTDGYYVLNVQTTEISDLSGIFGETGKQATWTQFAHIPFIEEFIGLPDSSAGSPVDFILVRFNVPIDQSTLLPERLVWKKDGITMSGQVGITSMDLEGKLFRISGLITFLSDDGKYSLIVDLPNIISIEGINGAVTQTVEWEIDQQPPRIIKITKKKEGGFDAQHVTAIEIQFNEPVIGFGLSSIELWKDGLRQPLSQLTFTAISGSEFRFTQFRLLTYYEGNYTLKVRMDGIADKSGNTATGLVEYKWIVNRKAPIAVTGLRIMPDMGFSDTDAVTANGKIVAIMNVNAPDSRIQLYQNDIDNLTLLADIPNLAIGPLTAPVEFTITGNLTLEAHCLDSLGNAAVTELQVFIDEIALLANWQNVPVYPQTVNPDSLLLEFSDKLLDDSAIKGYLKFERDGQLLGNENITINKLSEKLYLLKGMDLAGNRPGDYSLSVDLTKLQKYTSGKQGVSAPEARWTVIRINQAPAAVILQQPDATQLLDATQPIVFSWTASTDPDNDPITYVLHIWNNMKDTTIAAIPVTSFTLPANRLKGHSTYWYTVTASDGMANTLSAEQKINTKNNLPPVAAITSPLAGVEATYTDGQLEITYAPNPEKDMDGDYLIAIIRLYGEGIDTTIITAGDQGIVYIPSKRLHDKQSYTIEGKLYDGAEYTPFASTITFTTPSGVGIDDLKSASGSLTVYPNPVKGSAIIHYVLNARARVRLSFCDLSGREIKLLVNSIQPPGEYTLELESEGYMTGTYVLRLMMKITDGKPFVETCKVMVQR
jgi:hypothetical protein